MEGRRWFQLHAVSHGDRPAMGQAQLSFAACDADRRRQLYRQPLLDLQEPSTEGADTSPRALRSSIPSSCKLNWEPFCRV